MKEPTLAEQIAQMERQKRLRHHLIDDDGRILDAIISTLRKFAEVERDAARYRWLRDVSNEEVDVTVPRLVEDQYPLKYCSYSGDELDMAIDASMRKP